MGNKKILIGILLAYTSLASQPADNQKIDEEKLLKVIIETVVFQLKNFL